MCTPFPFSGWAVEGDLFQGKEEGDLFQGKEEGDIFLGSGVYNFYIKNKVKSEIRNDKKRFINKIVLLCLRTENSEN